MSGDRLQFRRTDDGAFVAPLELSYPYARTVGDVLGRFFTSLRDGRIEGTRGDDGRVFVPPAEFDPMSGAPCTEWVSVAETGTVTTWSWQAPAKPDQPLDHPFAWALIRLDGADVPLLHAVDAGTPEAIRTGARVAVRWAGERHGGITDIACFDLVAGDVEGAS